MTKPWQIFTKWSIFGSLGLALFYFLLSSLLSGGISHSLDQFVILQPWISLLILSFGVQMGLFQLVRKGFRLVGSSSTVSGVSMLLCCVHHASDLLPILGVSALGLVLTAYQKDFLIFGVLMNILGIFYMAKLMRLTDKPVFKYLFMSSAVLVLAFGVFTITKDVFAKKPSSLGASVKVNPMEAQVKQVGVVDMEITPKQLARGREMVFTVSLDNHSIDLNYDYTKIVVVVDDTGNIYKPVKWTGESAGHHVSGDLVFNKLSGKASSVGLNIKGIDGKNVVFNWEL
ncbi:MAG: hypothetical protein ACD_13C00022G0020 [uncultured bacterium]|uniref:Uncharacterized protein n=1 Tax=Candidatus Woesebacteria bacterium GW2011_GWA1_40_43 TaxID=1618553 RepID=A0A0G0SHK1_9BACT|nr:MAG: hypothetical protein ACD_13C00022G0020 [uncultured bacterium]KKR53261.1 MAG: hypothetical protein UT88_C0012G0025 [Candidatus Woesebacteria bacterium GW2011_GWD2_40_19]KKR58101.1 MAG: hypothetical protein UT96_C0010G0027 [Candidatus Woesebacteria bacterium GW2011_GWC2_40_30]KKR64363.1 MAG: hypothetical protein UU02_C0009G0012 [Candidatus Woesebacteria bacterium GW2011_GWA1_40_43]HAU64966.1 hypothetical protein [Candidatus Woesebacteria bacterium]